jgi:two-component system phosphate regulon sensor histidine kinase PhoR
MTTSRFQDASLYELAASLEQASHPLQISPATFKAMLSVILEVLIEGQVPAKLWLKLPRGRVWAQELERYSRAAHPDSVIYRLGVSLGTGSLASEGRSSTRDRSDADADSASYDWDSSADLDLSLDPSAALSPCPQYGLPLATDSHLRRDYFLIVRSPQFSLLLLAHRPRTVRSHSTPDPSPPPLRSHTAAILSDESGSSSRKHPLLSVFSFAPETIHGVLEGLYPAVQAGQAQHPCPEGAQVLAQWETRVDSAAIAPPSPALLTLFYSRQIAHQEALWAQSVADRKLSEQVNALQLECEDLTNRLRLKDEFLKNVGQEMRTPLTNMKTAMTLLLESPNLRPSQRERYIELLTKECERQSNLITSVLDLLHLEDHADQALLQPIRLVDVVPGVVSTYQPLARERGIMLAYTIPDELPAVSCLRNWLNQIAVNLLHNAIKFTPQGGKVWVSAKQQGDYVQLEVKDTGVGIAPGELSRVFTPFYRLRNASDPQAAGSGLGLSMVQQLAINCGGSVSVRSRPGDGSTFSVLLPIYNM